MAIAAVDRFAGPSVYRPIESPRFDRTEEAAPTNRSVAFERPVATIFEQPAPSNSSLVSLTASARAATVALAATPRDAAASVYGARTATSDAQDAALAALTDPTAAPTPREIAQSFAAVAALVPSPQRLVNQAANANASDNRVEAAEPVATVGARLSRFA